jgi:hypothetical protein
LLEKDLDLERMAAVVDKRLYRRKIDQERLVPELGVDMP